MDSAIHGRVSGFIEENFLFRAGGAQLADTDSLLEGGVIDSTGILELVAFLESEFPITMTDAEIVPENLDSVASITRYVERKLATAIAA